MYHSVIYKNKQLPSQQIYNNLSIENVNTTVDRHIEAARCSTIGTFERRTYFRYDAVERPPGVAFFIF